MRVAIGQFRELSEERLRFAVQLGASGVVLNTPILPGTQHWDYDDLRGLSDRCGTYGLRLESLENVPVSFYDKAMLGLAGRDEQIEHYQQTIRNMGLGRHPRAGLSLDAERCLAHLFRYTWTRRRPGLLLRPGAGRCRYAHP